MMMTDPVILATVAVACAFLGTKLDSFALWGIAVGMFFWSGVLYSIA